MSLEVALSVAALAVAVGVAFAEWRHRKRTTVLEEARRRDELRPRLQVEVERDSGNRILAIRNEGPCDLDRVGVEVTERPPFIISFEHDGVVSEFGFEDLGPLRIGGQHTIDLERDTRKAGGHLALVVHCASDGYCWRIPFRMKLYSGGAAFG